MHLDIKANLKIGSPEEMATREDLRDQWQRWFDSKPWKDGKKKFEEDGKKGCKHDMKVAYTSNEILMSGVCSMCRQCGFTIKEYTQK